MVVTMQIAVAAFLVSAAVLALGVSAVRVARRASGRRALSALRSRLVPLLGDAPVILGPDVISDDPPRRGVVLGTESTILWSDGSLEQYLGRAPGAVLGAGYARIVHPDDIERLSQESARVGGALGGVYRYRHASGHYLHVLWEWGWLNLRPPGCDSPVWVNTCVWHDVQGVAMRRKADALLSAAEAMGGAELG